MADTCFTSKEIIDISELSYLDINDQKVEKKGNISYK